MQPNAIIPVFPLRLVAFPGQVVPLHIFEDRYKRMIADVTAEGSQPFGISLDDEGDMADIGCAVRVTQRSEPADDGSFDVVTRAERRYRLVEVIEEQPYLRARVEYFGDEDAEPGDPALRALVAARFGSLVGLAAEEAGTQVVDGGRAGKAAAPDPEQIEAWGVAQRMGLDAGRRQALLELRSENARLQHLAEILEELLPILEERQARKRRVKSNGHNH